MGKDTVRDARVKACPECGTRFAPAAEFCSFDGTALETSTWDPSRAPLTGTLVAGRYEVLDPIGEGGMGIVYRVRHVGLDRHFAMKVLLPKLASEPRTAARFVQEAKATAAIKHPGVVAINDFGDLDDGTPYLVMELLSGETLAQRLKRGALPHAEAVSLTTMIASALSASHAAGVVHRDLKPDNVFLVGDGHGGPPESGIRLVDFGAAKVASGSKLTRPGMVFGTPHYMSPEQAAGQPVDGRSDVYALGVVLFEMLTGRVPFEADSFMGVLTLQMFSAPPAPSALVPPGTIPKGLEAVTLRALAKEPADRYPTMDAFAEALRTANTAPLLPRGPTVRMPDAPRSSPDLIDRMERIALEVDARERRRSWWLAAAVVVGVAAVTLAVTLSLVRPSPRSARASAPAPAPTPTPLAVPVPVSVPVSVPTPVPVSVPASTPAAAATPAPTPTPTPAPVRKTAPVTSTAPSAPPPAEFPDPWRK